MTATNPKSSAVEIAPIIKHMDVRRSAADAFRLFTAEMTAWWPMKTHSRAKDALGELTIRVDCEMRIGGRLYETLNTGEERDWGEVLAIEPGRLIRFSFQMGRDKDKSGEVEVRFDPIDDTSCRVTLKHEHWERLGSEGADMRNRFANGWETAFHEGFGTFAGRV